MVWWRGLGAVLVVLSGLVLVAPAPGWACSCGVPGGNVAKSFTKSADVVLVGTVTDREPPPPDEIMSTSDPATYTVAVERVLKGEAAATAEVLSAVSGASCGLEGIEIGAEYVVFAHLEGGDLWANACGGTQPASLDFVGEVEDVTGSGEVIAVGGDEIAPQTLGNDVLPARLAVPWWAWAGGLGLVVGLGVVATVVVGGRRRA